MANVHGRHGALYFAVTGLAVPVGSTSDISISAGANIADTTAQGSNFQTGIPGIPTFQVSLKQFYDDSYHVLVEAAISGASGKMYWYPDRRNATVYFYNNSFVGLDNWAAAVGDAESQGFTLSPASNTVYVRP